MARAYICLARNDLDQNLLQVLDLKPNSSQRNPSLDPAGQTGYLTYLPQHDTIAVASVDYYGLAAYLWDSIEDHDNGGGNKHLTVARCNTLAASILTYLGAGTTMTVTTLNGLIQAATGGVTSTLNTNRSIGTVEDILRILSGEVFYLPAGAIGGDAGAFAAVYYHAGYFLEANAVGSIHCASVSVDDYVILGGVRLTAKATADFSAQQFSQSDTDSLDASSLCDLINDHRTQALIKGHNNGVTVTATVASNKVTLHASVPGTAGELSLTTSAATKLVILAPDWVEGSFRPFRKIANVGALHLSVATGALSKLHNIFYTWINPAFTYGSGGTALQVNGTTHIGTAGQQRAVLIYDASGNLI